MTRKCSICGKQVEVYMEYGKPRLRLHGPGAHGRFYCEGSNTVVVKLKPSEKKKLHKQ